MATSDRYLSAVMNSVLGAENMGNSSPWSKAVHRASSWADADLFANRNSKNGEQWKSVTRGETPNKTAVASERERDGG